MMDLYISGCLYLIGSLFMLLNYEPEEGAPKHLYMMFVFGWPAMTIWLLLTDLFGNE